MANNEFMALFGPDKFTANVFSEANAVNYRLVVRGSNSDSANNSIEVSINGTDIVNRNVQRSRGMNLAVIDGTTLLLSEYKCFDLVDNIVLNGGAMKDYINSLPGNMIVCMYSYDSINSDASFDQTMKVFGSVVWPGARFFSLPSTSTSVKKNSSYCAIYSSTMKKICLENFTGGSRTLRADTRSFVEVVFDEMNDIGITGIPEKMVNDPTVYSSNGSVYKFKSYGVWNIGTDVYKNDTFRVDAELYVSQELRDAGGDCYLYMWVQSASGQSVQTSLLRTQGLSAGEWHKLNMLFTIPNRDDIVTMGCDVYHYPSTVTTGLAQSKNVVICKVPKIEVPRKGAAIGINGIRMSNMVETDSNGNPVNSLLAVPVSTTGTISDKTISSHNFSEMDYIFSDPTEYVSTNTTYLVKEYTVSPNLNSLCLLSSLGISVGDGIRISSQMKRDSTAISNSKAMLLTVRFYDSNKSILSDLSISDVSSIPNVYSFYTGDGVVPVGSMYFDFGLYRSPNNGSAGSVSAKNIKMSVIR